MTYLDRTFCASPGCENKCGRKMTDEQRERLKVIRVLHPFISVAYVYFCGPPLSVTGYVRVENNNSNRKNRSAKLSEDQVRQIRIAGPVTKEEQQVWAAKFKISVHTVREIVLRKTWKHVGLGND